VKDWLIKNGIKPIGVNVFTRGVHARRSLILFERALGHQIAVGVIAGTEDTYDPSRWWLTRKGFLETTREMVGCLDAVLVPLPDNLPGSQDLSHENVQTVYQVEASSWRAISLIPTRLNNIRINVIDRCGCSLAL
jgi:hypothetical protein